MPNTRPRDAPRHHLVLGGSQGIGFAYAAHMAAGGDTLTVVARRAEILSVAKDRLLRIGAAAVDIVSGDLVDPAFRAALKEMRQGYDSVFVSGPSPPVGGPELLGDPRWHDLATRGCVAALIYPTDIIQWAFDRGTARGGTVFLVTSAVTLAPTLDRRFFLSQIYRTELERIAHFLAPLLSKRGVQLRIWRPKVVLTQLAVAYASALTGTSGTVSEAVATNVLSKEFGEATIPSAEQYVRLQLRDDYARHTG